jgi:GNAT superfamily N-acetyltransferase
VNVELRRGRFSISTDRIDVDAVHGYLSRSYWAEGIPKEIVAKSIECSLCFSLFDDSRQIGLARVVTDRSTYAYLCDVYVLEEFRGQGLGKWMMEVVLSHPELQNLRRFTLATRDAHGLYLQFGFAPIQKPENYMEIRKADPYKSQVKS